MPFSQFSTFLRASLDSRQNSANMPCGLVNSAILSTTSFNERLVDSVTYITPHSIVYLDCILHKVWCILVRMSGSTLKELAESVGLGPVEVCHEAGISDSTLYKVYNDIHVRATTRVRVEQAIKRLIQKTQAKAVPA